MEIILDDAGNSIDDSLSQGTKSKKIHSQKAAKHDVKSNLETNRIHDDDDTNDNVFDYLDDEFDDEFDEQYDENDGCDNRQGIYKCDMVTDDSNNNNNNNNQKNANKNFKFTNRHNSNSSSSSLNRSFNKNLLNYRKNENNNSLNSYNILNRNRNDSLSNVSLISLSSSEGDCLDEDNFDMDAIASSASNQFNNKPTSNSLHSIKERERRFKLKKMFDALKIVSYKLTHPINLSDSLNQQTRIIELNEANSTLRIKSKQKALMEVCITKSRISIFVYNIKMFYF